MLDVAVPADSAKRPQSAVDYAADHPALPPADSLRCSADAADVTSRPPLTAAEGAMHVALPAAGGAMRLDLPCAVVPLRPNPLCIAEAVRYDLECGNEAVQHRIGISRWP